MRSNFYRIKYIVHGIEKYIYKMENTDVCMRFICIVIYISCILSSCYTARQNVFTECAFGKIAIGDSIDNVVQLYGQPFQIFSIGRELYEYEYLERWFIGNEAIVQKKYYFLVRDKKILNKRMRTTIPPSYDSSYYYRSIQELEY